MNTREAKSLCPILTFFVVTEKPGITEFKTKWSQFNGYGIGFLLLLFGLFPLNTLSFCRSVGLFIISSSKSPSLLIWRYLLELHS